MNNKAHKAPLVRLSRPQKSGSLKFTQKVDYAIILLTTLAENPQIQKSLKEIASQKKLSFLFLQKVARTLQQEGFIKSERGKFGGYKLNQPSKKITLKQIIESIEGPVAIAPCLADNTICQKMKDCSIRKKMHQLNSEIQNLVLSKNIEFFIS